MVGAQAFSQASIEGIGVSGAGQNLVTMTLAECVNIAFYNNQDVLQAQLQVERGKLALSQSKINLLPTLNAGYTTGINLGRSIDPFTNAYVNQQYNYASPILSGGVTLFKGFALFNAIRRNSFVYEADKLEVQQAKELLALNIIRAYLNVLSKKELAALANTQKEAAGKQLDRIATLYEQEAIAPGEYYDLKGLYAGDELSVINALKALEDAKLVLAQLMNIPYAKNMQLPPLDAETMTLDDTVSSEAIYEAALENLSMVKVAGLRRKASEMDIRLSRSGFFPSLALYAGANSNYSGAADIKYNEQILNNRNSSFSVGLSVPILNGFRTRNAVKLAKIEQDNALALEKTTQIQLRQIVEEAFYNMQFSKEKYAVSKRQENAFRESFQRAQSRYSFGAGTIVDFIVSKSAYDKSAINLVNARYDYVFSMRILDFLQGKMKF